MVFVGIKDCFAEGISVSPKPMWFNLLQMTPLFKFIHIIFPLQENEQNYSSYYKDQPHTDFYNKNSFQKLFLCCWNAHNRLKEDDTELLID